MVDTGASVNILDEQTHRSIGGPKLTKRNLPNLHPYGGGPPLQVSGMCDIVIETTRKMAIHKFHVVQWDHGTLLGYAAAKELGLVHIVNGLAVNPVEKYPKLFKGIGKLNDRTVRLHINKNVKHSPSSQEPSKTRN